MLKIKVYVRNGKTKDGKDFKSYSAKTKKGEWVDVVFSKLTQKPEQASVIEVSNENIFKGTTPDGKRDSFVVMKVETMTPITRELIEDDFFD